MKNLFKYAFTLVVSALVLSACTDEYEYDAPAAYEGFYITSGRSNYDYTVEDEVKSFTVKVVRPQGGGEETIALASDNELFDLPESVTFEAGQTEAEVNVTCTLDAGQSETVKISLPEGTYDATYFSGAFTVKVFCDYLWEEAGTATFHSSLLSDGFGANGTIEDVKVRHAVNTNIYELVGPYKAGYNLRFTLNEDYDAEDLPEEQEMGLTNNGVGLLMAHIPEHGSKFTNDGNEFEMYVHIFDANGNYFTLWTESFVWDGWPGGGE